MLTIVVNADDAGMSTEVNEAIFDLMARERLFSATLLANGPALDDALARVPLFPHCSFGVHLNLTEFGPLTNHHDLAPLLDTTGRFNGDIVRRLPLSRRLVRAVCEEWCAQVARVRDAGVEVSHLDSHNHIHTTPALLPALKMVQRRHGIRRVRNTRNLYRPPAPKPSRLSRWRKAVWTLALRRFPPAAWTTDVFTGLRDFCEVAAHRSWQGIRTVELMTHPGNPGHAEDRLILDSAWLAQLGCSAKLTCYREVQR